MTSTCLQCRSAGPTYAVAVARITQGSRRRTANGAMPGPDSEACTRTKITKPFLGSIACLRGDPHAPHHTLKQKIVWQAAVHTLLPTPSYQNSLPRACLLYAAATWRGVCPKELQHARSFQVQALGKQVKAKL